ncbi:MAG TPA: hypothetical protein DCZ10_02760, partial [Pelotomaculum sp.]|nr:hypothetical protein [Pelotomaculum sp.]
MTIPAVLIISVLLIVNTAASANEASQNTNTQSLGKNGPIQVTYTVKEGDNLCSIA